MQNLKFPSGFLWGASTASHQVEGGTVNQWSVWEKSPARMAELERDGLIAEHGRDNFISGRAADHYHRFEEDFALAKSLGHNATRISIEWSRVEPRAGEFNKAEIEHYRKVIASIRANGMEPFVTLWHWTLPLWFVERGGFERHGNVRFFAGYAEKMAAEFPEVKFWLTLNEPEIYAAMSYRRGEWPPQKTSVVAELRVFRNLIAAHRAAYRAMKRANPARQIGVAKNNAWYEAYHNAFTARMLKRILDWGRNFYFLNRIRHHQDFVGLNHYFHNRIKNFRANQNENVRTSDLSWELYPEAIYHVLMDIKKYRVPVYVTENGLADASDSQREWFIKTTLAQVHRAIGGGADVRGYLHWSLMDNFEWAHGFWPRFGLIEIDYATLARKPRPSALAYKKICEENGVSLNE